MIATRKRAAERVARWPKWKREINLGRIYGFSARSHASSASDPQNQHTSGSAGLALNARIGRQYPFVPDITGETDGPTVTTD